MSSPKPQSRVEFSILVVMLAIFVAAFIGSFTFIPPTHSYPRVVSAIGAILTFIELLIFTYQTWRRRKELLPVRQELGNMLANIVSVVLTSVDSALCFIVAVF